MDDLETAGLAFGRLCCRVHPHQWWCRSLMLSALPPTAAQTGATKEEDALADGAAVIKAVSAACTAMDERGGAAAPTATCSSRPALLQAWYRTWTPPRAARC
ncbi:MAG: hypothetical protein ACLTZH_03290 [Subdoligranulum sp.]